MKKLSTNNRIYSAKTATFGLQISLLLLVVVGQLVDAVSSPLFENISKDVLESASEPKAVAVAEPNLGALLGLGSPLSAHQAGLLQGLGGHGAAGNAAGLPNIQALKDAGNLCNNNGGTSDALTNLLVYQYLSGGLPPGAANSQNAANAVAAAAAARHAATDTHLQALLEASRESRTASTVTTTLTTRTITLEASTQVSVSTSIYVTTITTIDSSVLPIIFRGSKITTTITERATDILTATEFFTSSSVRTPSIIQTLPVEVTLIETSTKGLNGQFTLAHVTPGASKVIEQPISSSSVHFDTQGLDISSLDLSKLDFGGLRGGDNAQMVNALTALLQQYHEGDEGVEDPRSKKKNRGPNRGRNDRNNSNTRDKGRANGNTRFHSQSQSRFSDPRFQDDPPKFNVIRGFTLDDERAPANSNSGSSGTALENTRYSKFRKKDNVENNSLSTTESDRESERFSASTSRRTVSRADERQAAPQRSRSQTTPSGTSSRNSGVRANRQTERSRRRSGRTLQNNNEGVNYFNTFSTHFTKDDVHTLQTSVLTIYISGVKPGEIITTTRAITLRGVTNSRSKRHAIPEPLESAMTIYISDVNPGEISTSTRTITVRGEPEMIPDPTSVEIEPILNTQVPDLTSALKPDEVVKLLKKLDKSKVKEMLLSLQGWVDYYLHEVLDEAIEPSFLLGRLKDISNNDIPELISSQLEEDTDSFMQDATVALTSLPNAITREPVVASSSNLCPKASVVTQTVYQTVYNSLIK